FKEFIFCEAMFFAIELTRFFEINVLTAECGRTIDLTKELACIDIIQSLKATGLHDFNRRSKRIAVELSHTYILIVHISSFVKVWTLSGHAYRTGILITF